MENAVDCRQVPGDQAREEILDYFQNHAGVKLYVVNISKDLRLDVGLVSRIATDLLAEGVIQLAETGSN